MVADGYKETKVGIVPFDWNIVELGSICSTTTGKLNANAMVENGKYRFFTCAKEPYLIDEYKFDTEALLISGNGANVGYIHYYNGKFNAYQRTYVLDKFTNDIQYIKYILQRLLKDRIDKEKNAGNTPYITLDTITEMKIPLPLLKEQEKIADILSTADDKIDAIATQIEKSETLKKGLLQKLLSEGIGHSEFKDSELGKIPESWEASQVGYNIIFSGGAQPPRNTFIFEPKEGYIRLLQIRDYKSDKFQTYIKKDLARKFCLKDDVMIGRYGPPIFQILRGLEGAYNVALIKAIPNKSIEKDFMYYILIQDKLFNFIENLSQRSSGQTGIDMEGLKTYPLALPPLEEQKQIADILSTADEKLEVLRAKKEKYETLKKGLLQKLLSGEVRV